MNISLVTIEDSAAGYKNVCTGIEMDGKNEQAHFLFKNRVLPGQYKLHISFSAKLNDQLRGFYRSHYKDSAGEKHWLVNAGAGGFYRVLYLPARLNKLLLQFDLLTPEERLSLLFDVATLSWKGTLPVESNLDLMLKIKTEQDSIVQAALVSRFFGPRHFMYAGTLPQYQQFVRAYLKPLMNKLGFEEKAGEEETLKDLRAQVIEALGTFGQDPGAIKEAEMRFAEYLADRQSVSADIVGAVLNTVAYNGDKKEYEQIKAGWKKAANPQEEKRFLTALSQFRRPELVEETLELLLNPEMRATDTVTVHILWNQQEAPWIDRWKMFTLLCCTGSATRLVSGNGLPGKPELCLTDFEVAAPVSGI